MSASSIHAGSEGASASDAAVAVAVASTDSGLEAAAGGAGAGAGAGAADSEATDASSRAKREDVTGGSSSSSSALKKRRVTRGSTNYNKFEGLRLSNITQQNMLLRLPARLTVAQLLDTFVNTSRSKAESAYLAKGLRELFNDTLPQGLLYRFERPQFESLFGLDKRGRKGGRVQKRQPAEVYGTEHFLRFIVKLREVLDVSMYSATDLVDLEKYLMLFLKFMNRNPPKYFIGQYYKPGPDYAAKVSVG